VLANTFIHSIGGHLGLRKSKPVEPVEGMHSAGEEDIATETSPIDPKVTAGEQMRKKDDDKPCQCFMVLHYFGEY
jgi:hypothetical protein